MDQTEVTNSMYARCVKAGKCKFTVENAATDIHFNDPAYADHPVVYVKWEWAAANCQWAGRRLPSEAEWEKAARGTDERKYPWGNEPPNAARLNFNDLVGDTSVVGSYPAGVSPYGILDLAGNVREWVADWFSAQYYLNSPFKNPLGPAKGQFKVLRGGSFKDGYAGVLATTRFSHIPGSPGMNRGFRCVSP
jgi:formylglycine-generating enzyme required for sulfatase activity